MTPQPSTAATPTGCMSPGANVLEAAYARNPERFVRKPPAPPELPAAAWIDKPTNATEAAY